MQRPLELAPSPHRRVAKTLSLTLLERMRNTIVAGFLLSSAGAALAFQQCPSGTRPCASAAQAIIYWGLPTVVAGVLAIVANRKIKSSWLRRGTVALVGVAWGIGALVVLAAFGLFLAPCSAVCWYGVA